MNNLPSRHTIAVRPGSLAGLTLLGAVLIAAVLALGLATIGANDSGTTVTSGPVSWYMPPATCSDFPNAAVSATGTTRSVVTTSTNADGTTTIKNFSHASGTATDQDGNTYRWSYTNSFRITNTLANPALSSGRMQDVFFIIGRGPVHTFVAFDSGYWESGSTFGFFDQRWVIGNPLDFNNPTGPVYCDPL